MAESTDTVLGFTAQIVSAHVAKNPVEPDKLPDLIREVYRTLATVGEEPAESAKPKAAVPPTKSVFAGLHRLPGRRQEDEDAEAASDDGPQADAGSVPVPAGACHRSYPMVAANYAKTRSALAKKIGLGQKRSMPRKMGRKRASKA